VESINFAQLTIFIITGLTETTKNVELPLIQIWRDFINIIKSTAQKISLQKNS
jgi:hypothetical protein